MPPSVPAPAVRRAAAAAGPPVSNEVLLVGRVPAPAEERELPSGDVLVAFRVVVDRPPPRRPVREGARVPTVDSLACVAWPAAVRRTALSLAAGDLVEVRGALRQRFWRAGAGVGSRTEVDVEALRRLARAGEVRRRGGRAGAGRSGASA